MSGTEKHRSCAADSLQKDDCGVSTRRLWYVVKTKPREEQICIREMERQGIESLCPMTREFRFRRRRQEIVPLFPGYIFVRFAFPDEFNSVRWLRGVNNLVRFGNSDPPAVDSNEVALFIESMDENGVIDTSSELVEGQKVRFLSEPMKGMVGTILRCGSAQSRIRVLMDLLYQATVEVESYQVQSI